MNPIHAGWAMSAAGVFIFFSLGYLIHGLRRNGSGSRNLDEVKREILRRANEAIAAAESRAEGFARALSEERRLQVERVQAVEAQAESEALQLKQAVEDERGSHSEALKTTQELEKKIAELEGALARSKRDVETTRKTSSGAARGEIDELTGDLQKERATTSKLREELEKEHQRSQELLTEHYLMQEELTEERKRAYTATAKHEVIRGELEKVKRLMGKGTGEGREFELERSLKDVAEQAWPEGGGNGQRGTKGSKTKGLKARASTSSIPADSEAEIAKDLSWNRQGDRDSYIPSKPEHARTLEQRIRAFQEQRMGRPRESDHDPMNEKVLSGAIGDLVLQLASKRGIHSAVLADAQGLPFTGVGLPRFHDGIAAYSSLLGQLTEHTNEFLPMSKVSWCCLHDMDELIFSCWLFKVGNESFSLSTLSAEDAPNELVMRRTIDDLALALS